MYTYAKKKENFKFLFSSSLRLTMDWFLISSSFDMESSFQSKLYRVQRLDNHLFTANN